MAIILLVDDDPLQAFVRKTILDRKFPDVRRVGGAAEALCLVEQLHFAQHVGLVVSGHSIKGIGCPAFVAELHERLPEVPVLVLGDPSESHSEYSGDHVRFLPRPVNADEMVNLAAEMLAQSKQTMAAYPVSAAQ
jgi:DNA-binding NtrC family response regulator